MEKRFRFCRTPPSIWPRNTETKCHRAESSSFLSEIIVDENPPLEIVRWLRKNRPHLKVVQINLLATFHFSSSKNWIRRHNTSLPDNKRIIRLFWLLVQLHFSCNNLRPHQMRRSDTRQGPRLTSDVFRKQVGWGTWLSDIHHIFYLWLQIWSKISNHYLVFGGNLKKRKLKHLCQISLNLQSITLLFKYCVLFVSILHDKLAEKWGQLLCLRLHIFIFGFSSPLSHNPINFNSVSPILQNWSQLLPDSSYDDARLQIWTLNGIQKKISHRGIGK